MSSKLKILAHNMIHFIEKSLPLLDTEHVGVVYNFLPCRASSSEFTIPFNKFLKSLDQSFSSGMRFKMCFETEDAAERRFAIHGFVAFN